MPMRFLLVLVALMALTAPARPPATGPTPRFADDTCEGESCGRVFVVAVGYGGESSERFRSAFAESDAERFARRVVWESARRRGNSTAAGSLADADRLAGAGVELRRAREAYERGDSTAHAQVALLVGPGATLAGVREAFGRLNERVRPNDHVAFYFAGSSRNVTDTAGPRVDHYLRLSGAPMADDRRLRETGVSSEQLGYWLDQISAEQQLVVLEAGQGGAFLTAFVSALVERNALAARLSRRERLILGPRGSGLEQPGVGGVLTYAVSRSAEPILSIHTRPSTVTAALVREVQALTEDGEYLRLFDERDIREVWHGVSGRVPVPTRGVVTNPAPAAPSAAPSGRNLALIIGTDRYAAAAAWPALANPVRDASAVASELARSFGFDTTVLRDPTRDEILAALVDLAGREYGPQDQLVVFVAGHGYYDELLRMGHLVARDSRPVREDRFKSTYISHGQLAQYLEAIPNRHILLVLDACFGGAFADDVAAGSRAEAEYADADLAGFVSRKLEYRSRLYITSGGTEYVSDGRPGEHSPFARRFLGTLREAAASGRPLTISGLRSGVEAARPGPRSGEFGRSEPGGDIVLLPRRRGE
jgi:uncharacterized caspase-like protein